jgi:hypothetical protein
MTMRKGPDGRTIHTPEDGPEDATRKVPRRSIRDRLLASEADDEMPATRIAGDMTTDGGPTAPGPGPSPSAKDPNVPETVMAPTVRLPREPAPAPSPKPPLPEAAPAAGGPTLYAAAPKPAAPAASTPAAPPPIPPPPPPAAAAPASAPESMPTQIYRPNRAASPPPPPAPAAAPAAGTAVVGKAGKPVQGAPVSEDFTIADPIVGWLVITDGPGRGASLTIGYGNNRIGRAATENISLDFGDEQISRENHATITFDGRHRRFYVLPGQGRNLAYVNDTPVMSPVELVGGEDLLLGNTKLRFVPFCGKSFDWYRK